MSISTAIILFLVFSCSEASQTKETTEKLRNNGNDVSVTWIKGGNVWLPLYIRTTIKQTYPGTQRTNFGLKEHENQMKNMKAREGDQRGHLVASSIGGPAELWNLAPQTGKVNQGDGSGDGWSTLEGDVRKYLKIAGNTVEWSVYVHYGNLSKSNRPIAFTAVAKFSNRKKVSMKCDNNTQLRVCQRG